MSTVSTGTVPIKAEYLIHLEPSVAYIPDDDAAEGNTAFSSNRDTPRDSRDSRDGGGRQKSKKYVQRSKEEKKAHQGANTGRRFAKVKDETDLCWTIAVGDPCEFGDQCRTSHDVEAYMAKKPKDIQIPSLSSFSATEPFVSISTDTEMSMEGHASIDFNTTCPNFQSFGFCKFGLKCRFLGGHTRIDDTGKLHQIVDEEKKSKAAISETELNSCDSQTLSKLRTKKYPLPITEEYLKELEDKSNPKQTIIMAEPEQVMEDDSVDIITQRIGDTSSQIDTPEVPTRHSEKKRLHWSGKTYLAPLTTVGNLPFRRLCVSFGADITCGEMGLATSFLGGSKEEWSLVRRHPSEGIFGVQLAGSKPATLVPTAEVIARECSGNVDFVDVNCGCPIDLVVRSGSGAALLDAAGKLGKILVGMNRALGDIPLTVKLRTGVKANSHTAHKLMPRLASEWNASSLTLHGRSRQQRYTKLADWNYIKQCVDAVRAREEEKDLQRIPIFGGGDCYSSEEYWADVESSGVDGVMLARGALIKPWIFTEIKERREWDISSRERLDLIRQYAEYGLNHFGSDTAGVNTTRRYLCEALSFQYRYVPIGLLERLPGRLNERPPAFRGRDDLETLLSSNNSADWVRISEMMLGPAPESWHFTPKHKSNAYDTAQEG